jgi:acyl-CoA reductase-like NAD-dependent aldehyde dehydrogenase
MANSKVIVERAIFDEFCEKFVAKAQQVKVGDPTDPKTVVGPLIRRSQCAFIDGHVQDATDKGAKLLTGGTHEGSFYRKRPFDRTFKCVGEWAIV